MIRLEDINCTFNPGTPLEVKAIHSLNLHLNSGEYVMLVGSNGSGKSTLLNLLSGTTFPTGGKIFFDKTNITRLSDFRKSRWIARVWQDPFQGTAADLSILDNFRLAALRDGYKKLQIGTTNLFRELVRNAISRLQLGLENNPDRIMGSLSGGQRQALTLLMAVMSPCKLLLMDEPTSALDPKTAEMVMRIADDLIRQHNLTTLHVTHRMKDASKYGTRLLMMKEGKLVRDLQGEEKKNMTPAMLFEWF